MLDERIRKITDKDRGLGPPDAPVTVLEYGDFECPYSARARPELKALVEEYPDMIRLVYRHFPMTAIHPYSFAAAEAAEAAGMQRKFWEMHDILFTHQQHLEPEDLHGYAMDLNLDVARFDWELEAHVHSAKVKLDLHMGIEDGVNETPAIFMNEVRYDGPRDRVSMAAAINALLKAGAAARRSRTGRTRARRSRGSRA